MSINAVVAETPQPFPFEGMELRDDAILATFPSAGIRWIVKLNSEAPHISNYNETIILHAGDILVLTEKHSSAKITPILTGANPGLQITKSSDPQLGNKTEAIFFPVLHK